MPGEVRTALDIMPGEVRISLDIMPGEVRIAIDIMPAEVRISIALDLILEIPHTRPSYPSPSYSPLKTGG